MTDKCVPIAVLQVMARSLQQDPHASIRRAEQIVEQMESGEKDGSSNTIPNTFTYAGMSLYILCIRKG